MCRSDANNTCAVLVEAYIVGQAVTVISEDMVQVWVEVCGGPVVVVIRHASEQARDLLSRTT